MNSKRLFFIVGAAALLLIFTAAVLSVDSGLGVFSRQGVPGELTAENVAGDVSVRRDGAAYTLKDGMELRQGDVILVGRRAGCEVVANGNVRATLAMDARLRISEFTEKRLAFAVEQGAVFFDLIQTGGPRSMAFAAGETGVSPGSGAVFSVEAYTGAQTVNVYAGDADCTAQGKTVPLTAGKQAAVVQTEEGTSISCLDIPAGELMSFLLRELIDRDGLCFDTGALQAALDSRGADTASAASPGEERMTCTVELRCDAALERLDPLPGEVPEDGTILPVTTVKFTQGESVFDVLRRVCRAVGVEMDYNYTPLFGGYYITQIGPLRESDCGPLSGWLYKVNGWYPNYGASLYRVEPGDEIVWQYTCEGCGTDLGREEWREYPVN